MSLEKAAHWANIFAILPAYIMLWMVLRPRPQQSGEVMASGHSLLDASIYAFFILFTFGAILSVIVLSRKKLPNEPSHDPRGPILTVRDARYGIGGQSYQDVTALLRKYIKLNKINIPVSNDTFKSDPYPGVVKHVAVSYIYGVPQMRVMKREGEQLVLPSPRHLLRDKVESLGRDLFAFLREKGPMPANPINNLRTTDSQWRAIGDAWDHYVDAIHYGYGRLFKSRAIDLFNELAENHISFKLEQYEIDPPQVARETSVRKIAEECLLIVVRMEIEDESQGT